MEICSFKEFALCRFETNKLTMKHISYLFILFLSVNTLNAQIVVSEVSSIPEKVSNNAVCEGFINDSAYVFSFGGIDSTKLYSGIHLRSYRYNVSTGNTIQISSLPDTLGKIAAAASRINNIIYISGGYHVFQNGSEISSNKMHRYDVENDIYLIDGQDIPIAIDDHVQAVWRDSLIFIITGWSNNGNIPNVQIYNASTDSWITGTSTPNNNSYKSFGASGTIVEDSIYYFGGASSGFGFGVQNQLRKGVINPSDPSQIEWSISTPDPSINGYRMAATHIEDKLYWIGGSNTTYNFNGIAYNGSGGVPPSNRILSTIVGDISWDELFFDEIPMDLRGIANVNETTSYLIGGMTADQTVTNKIYKIEFNTVVGLNSENAFPNSFDLYPNPFNDFIKIRSTQKSEVKFTMYDLAGKEILRQTLIMGINEVNVESIPNGFYLVELRDGENNYVHKVIKN